VSVISPAPFGHDAALYFSHSFGNQPISFALAESKVGTDSASCYFSLAKQSVDRPFADSSVLGQFLQRHERMRETLHSRSSITSAEPVSESHGFSMQILISSVISGPSDVESANERRWRFFARQADVASHAYRFLRYSRIRHAFLTISPLQTPPLGGGHEWPSHRLTSPRGRPLLST